MEILIVDDDLEYSNFLKDMILGSSKSSDLKVTIENDSENALELISNNFYKIVIYDVFMTKINGLSFLKEAKKINTHTVFILVSLVYDERLKQDVILNGAYDYYKKNSYYTITKEVMRIIRDEGKIRI